MSDSKTTDFHDGAGGWLGAVVPHPRMLGMWMAMWCPALITQDKPSGMKRYKTRRGALACVEKKIASGAK